MADDDFTELQDADIDTVHTVAAAANGTTILFAKSADAGAEAPGIFEPDFVRDLVAKSNEQAAPAEQLTPAQAMALVHAATVRKAGLPAADGAAAGPETAEAAPVAKAEPAPTDSAAAATPTPEENAVSNADGTQTTDTQGTAAAAEPVAKAGGLSAEELAEIGRQALAKAAKKAAKKALKTSGATAATDDARVIPGTSTVQAPAQEPDGITKAAASDLATAFAEVMAPVVKQIQDLTTRVESQGERVEKMAQRPDDRKSPVLNGASGTAQIAERGPSAATRSPEFAAVQKAIEALPEGPARENAQREVALAAIKGRFGRPD